MVVVELGGVEDAAERESYLAFLAENDIAFVRSQDGNSYTAEVALVDDEDDDNEEDYENGDDGDDDDDLRRVNGGGGRESDAFEEIRLALDQQQQQQQQQQQGRRQSALSSGMQRGAGARASAGGSLSGTRSITSGGRPPQETQRILRAFRKSADEEDFATYSKFCSLIEMRDKLDPRPRSLKWLSGLINDVYDDRAAVKSKYDLEELRIFPVFVMDHLGKRYGLRQIIDQVAWDMVLSVHTHRRHRIEVEVFARFLEEYYDREDLSFYLRVRSITDNIVQRSVRAGWSKESVSQRSTTSTRSDIHVYLKWNEVEAVAKHLFGSSDSAERQETFLALVDENAMPLSSDAESGYAGDSETNAPLVEVAQLLHLAVAQNHDIRAQSMSTDARMAHRRDEAMQDVFGNAQNAYHDKLRELGFAASVADDQLSRDLHRQRRLDEMCHAIKRALLENDATRDSLPDVNEATIREWAAGLMARETLDGAANQASRPLRDSQTQKRMPKSKASSGETLDSRYTRRDERGRGGPPSQQQSPPPPGSPRPPPPPYEDFEESPTAKSSSDFGSSAYELGGFYPSHSNASPASSVSKFVPIDASQGHHAEAKGGGLLPSALLHSSQQSSIPVLRTVSDLPPSSAEPSHTHPYSTPSERSFEATATTKHANHPAAAPRVPLSPPPPPPVAEGLTLSPSALSEPGNAWPGARGGMQAGRGGSAGSQVNPYQHRHTDAQNVMREIHVKLERAKQAYLASLMSSARDLPQTVLYEIEEEVRAQLDQKTRKILNDIVLGRRGASPGSSPVDPGLLQNHSHEQLVTVYKNILRSQRASDGSYLHLSRQVEELCEGILHSAELRQEVEPLVALLSTYANARLGNNRSRYL